MAQSRGFYARHEFNVDTAMITRAVDEVVHLADRIVPVINGPLAQVAEAVVNLLPAERVRSGPHRLPRYTALRNHLVDFLVERSRTFRGSPPLGYDRRRPPSVEIAEPMRLQAAPA